MDIIAIAIVGIVAIIAIVFGVPFKARVNKNGASWESDGPNAKAK